MDYMEACKDYFKDFVDQYEFDSIESYLEFMRENKTWGDDLEIQAMSEIYRRPIYIYSYSSEPSH